MPFTTGSLPDRRRTRPIDSGVVVMPEPTPVEYVITKVTTINETFGVKAMNPAEARALFDQNMANPVASNHSEQVNVQPRQMAGQPVMNMPAIRLPAAPIRTPQGPPQP
jgi:hypothetical protein